MSNRGIMMPDGYRDCEDVCKEFEIRKEEFTTFAEELAKKAGSIQMELYNSDHEIEWKDRIHFRAQTDKRVGELCREILSEKYPHHNIHSEEQSDHVTTSSFTWVIDELDGTIAYVRRFFDGFGFCIALCIDDIPVLGIVYMPFKQYLYKGVLGEQSYLNGQPIRVNGANSLNEIVMSFGSGKEIKGKEEFRSSDLPFLGKAMEYPGIIDDIGFTCASAVLCFVADGRMEAALFTSLEPEDMAAAVVILQGAGAVVTNLKFEPWRLGNKSIFTANPVIYVLLKERFEHIAQDHMEKFSIV